MRLPRKSAQSGATLALDGMVAGSMAADQQPVKTQQRADRALLKTAGIVGRAQWCVICRPTLTDTHHSPPQPCKHSSPAIILHVLLNIRCQAQPQTAKLSHRPIGVVQQARCCPPSG